MVETSVTILHKLVIQTTVIEFTLMAEVRNTKQVAQPTVLVIH